MKKHLLLLVMILLPIVASADAVDINGIWYNLDSSAKTAEVTSNPNKYTGTVVIPESVTDKGNAYSVTSIGVSAFKRCDGLTSITIPNSVTSIGGSAFWECSGLTSITIPNSVTSIGVRTFVGCSGLNSITIPNSVTNIGYGAFDGCSGLTSMSVEPENSVYDSRNGCNAIIETATNTLIAGCKNTIIPNSVTKIGAYAFFCCFGLSSVTIPNSVTSIGAEAFYCCSGLTSITIPNSVTSIGNAAFSGCSGLTSITIPNSIRRINESVFRGCSELTSVTIPSSVLGIGDYAFYFCKKLNSIIYEVTNPNVIKETVFSPETYSEATLTIPAFSKTFYQTTDFWNKFTNIVEHEPIERTIHMSTAGTLADRISEAEKYTIDKLVLTGEINGADLRLIRDMAGNNDKGKETEGRLKVLDLSGVELKEGPEPIMNSNVIVWGPVNKYLSASCALNGTNIISDLHSLPGCTFVGCTSLVSVSLPNNLTSIEGQVFLGCVNLTTINIPATVEYIGNVDGISPEYSEQTIWYENQPDGVVYLGNILYRYKGTMPENTVINIKEGTKGIASDAFRGCTGLTSVTIPNSVSTIGSYAFYDCTNLKTITIPESVYRIGGSAFGNTGWYDEQSEGPIYAGNVLYDYKGENAPININVKEGTLGIGGGSFNAFKTTESINIPSSTRYIGIRGGSSLQSINVDSNNGQYKSISGVLFSKDGSKLICYPENKSESNYSIPSGVKYIMGAFSSNENLESVTAPKSVVAIDRYSFHGCSKLSSIQLQDGLECISSSAIWYCRNLATITLPQSVTSIGDDAFLNCSSLSDVYCYAINVPYTNAGAFSGSPIENATLHVPAESVDAYKAATPWKNFKEILPLGETIKMAVASGDRTAIGYSSANGLDFTNVTDVKAWVVTGFMDDATVLLSRVKIVPPNTGLYLTSDVAGVEVDVPITNRDVYYMNMLLAAVNEETIDPTEVRNGVEYTNFVVGKLNSGEMGFVRVKNTRTLGPNKSRLLVPSSYYPVSNQAPELQVTFTEDASTTDLRSIDVTQPSDSHVFDLQGRKLSVDQAQKGIYIYRGKKYVIK